jgi:chromosome segregation ATPase
MMSDNNDYTMAELKEINEQLDRRYSSISRAAQNLELKNKGLEQEVGVLKQQLENADLNIAQQKTNLANVIAESNQSKQDMASEIGELRAKIKRLENGDND